VRRLSSAASLAVAGPVGLGLLALALYRTTLLPGVWWWDTGEFQTVGPLLGTAHPTGYPSYVILGWLASIVLAPAGEPAIRMNLLSAILVAAAVAGTAAIGRILTGWGWLGLVVGVGLALTPGVWAISTAADPHALQLGLVVAIVLVLLRWEAAVRAGTPTTDRLLFIAAALTGIAAGNHGLTALLAPWIAAFVLVVDPGLLRRPRRLGGCLALAVGVALAVYLELPLRAGLLRAPLVYGHPERLGGFLEIVTGAQFAGVRAMTATAGPGISLMQENLGWAGMCEIPVVVIDTQRGGPSTGMPTKHEQSDLFALCLGGHGEAPRIVIAPGTVEQAYRDAALAFNLADNYHCPVLIASDLGLAHWKASVPPFKLSEIRIDRGPRVSTEELLHMGRNAFQRYARTETGISARSLPGQPNGQYLASGAEHGPTGKVTEDPANRRYMMDRRLRRLRGPLVLDGQPVPGVEFSGDENPEVLLISYGSTIGAVWEGAEILRGEGIRTGVAQVRVIQPMPVQELQPLIDRAGHTFVVENNALGQLAFLMRAYGVHGRIGSVLKYDGTLFQADEVANRVKQALLTEGIAAD